MAYRGEDLDLRVSQQRGSRETYRSSEFGLNGARPRDPLPSGAREPLVVDDTVMACCNHAYDVAQAHGASEVRLEHLVHALTRVDAAADILEERGIREAHLRRESAAVIASEIPVGLAHSQSAPRASAEFEDVLRRASDQAQGQPGSRGATVHDLLWVLLNYDREIPAIALLLRHAAGWQSWDWPNRAVAASRIEQPRRVDPIRSPERLAPAPRTERTSDRGADRLADRRPLRQAPSGGDPVVARLDQMEGALRSLQSDMAADRRALTDLIRDLQRDVRDGHGLSSGDTNIMIEQLRAVEANVEDRLEHLARTATSLTDRLQALEGSVGGSLQEGSRNWVAVGERLKALDTVVSNNGTSGLADLVTDQLVTVTEQVRLLGQRLEVLEKSTEARQADNQRLVGGIGDQLRGLEETLGAQRRDVQAAVSINNPAAVQTMIGERFQALKGQIDQHHLDLTSAMARVVEPIAVRSQQAEAAADRKFGELLQRVEGLSQHIVGLDAAVKARVEGAHNELSEVHDALVKLGNNQQTLAGNLEQWRVESGGDLGIISNRIELLERGSARPLELLAQLQTDMQGVAQVALADYDHNRRGFKHWLFGTDEIFAGSWRDETAGLRARLKALKDGSADA